MSCSSTVMRPKSIATVVVVLFGTAAASSIPTDSEVISCSVLSGGISDSDPTNVVLPTPNPPATRTLSGRSPRVALGACLVLLAAGSACPDLAAGSAGPDLAAGSAGCGLIAGSAGCGLIADSAGGRPLLAGA